MNKIYDMPQILVNFNEINKFKILITKVKQKTDNFY